MHIWYDPRLTSRSIAVANRVFNLQRLPFSFIVVAPMYNRRSSVISWDITSPSELASKEVSKLCKSIGYLIKHYCHSSPLAPLTDTFASSSFLLCEFSNVFIRNRNNVGITKLHVTSAVVVLPYNHQVSFFGLHHYAIVSTKYRPPI